MARSLSLVILLLSAWGCSSGADSVVPTPVEQVANHDGGAPGSPDDSTGDGAPPGTSPPQAPLKTEPRLLIQEDGFYPRAIRSMDGTILVSVVSGQAGGGLGATILESTDQGVNFTVVGHVADPARTKVGLCCGTLYELPSAVGALAAGTLLWSASVGGDTPGQAMTIPVWKSADRGRTWAYLSTVATASKPASQGGRLWEPEFSLLPDGKLACHYSDESDPAHSQKLAVARTSDGITWGERHDTISLAASGQRPGMAIVRRAPDGHYVMSYEICGVPGDDCTAFMRTSADGWNWGAVTDRGLRIATLDGTTFHHAPAMALTAGPGRNGRLYVVGQEARAGNGQVSTAENGSVLFANTEAGARPWFTIPAPVPVAVPPLSPDYDPFVNYSSAILPLEGRREVSGSAGAWSEPEEQVALEVAIRKEGGRARPYFARGPLLGKGDASDVESGKAYRLVNVMSGLCLDVAGPGAGANVQQLGCNGQAPQSFTITKSPDGTATLKAQHSGMCVSVAGASTTAGANVEQQPCDGGSAQSWTLRNVGIGYYELSHTSTTSCLDVAGGSVASGANVQQWTCNALSPQIWRLR